MFEPPVRVCDDASSGYRSRSRPMASGTSATEVTLGQAASEQLRGGQRRVPDGQPDRVPGRDDVLRGGVGDRVCAPPG